MLCTEWELVLKQEINHDIARSRRCHTPNKAEIALQLKTKNMLCLMLYNRVELARKWVGIYRVDEAQFVGRRDKWSQKLSAIEFPL